MIKDIYSRTPVNSAAARVTSQTGCTTDDLVGQYESLQGAVKRLHLKLESQPKSERSAEDKENYQTLICELRKVKESLGKPGRKERKHQNRDLAHYFFDVVKNELPEFKFSELLRKARAAKSRDMEHAA